jgi:hypothetical protein
MRPLLFLTLLLAAATFSIAQNAVPSSGGDAKGAGGSVSYSVGQVVYTSNTGDNGSVAQGVQQPYEIFILTGVENYPAITLSFKAYPNPVTNLLILSAGNFGDEKLAYKLSDISGKNLLSNQIIEEITTIEMERYRSGAYFLSVIQNNSEIKTFKIIKN